MSGSMAEGAPCCREHHLATLSFEEGMSFPVDPRLLTSRRPCSLTFWPSLQPLPWHFHLSGPSVAFLCKGPQGCPYAPTSLAIIAGPPSELLPRECRWVLPDQVKCLRPSWSLPMSCPLPSPPQNTRPALETGSSPSRGELLWGLTLVLQANLLFLICFSRLHPRDIKGHHGCEHTLQLASPLRGNNNDDFIRLCFLSFASLT